MDRHHDVTFTALMMFMPVEPAPLFGEPLAEYCAFHGELLATRDDARDRLPAASMLYIAKSCERLC
jgi:hypothetical protein